MTQYTGFNMVGTFGSTTFSCLSSVDVDMTADIYTATCAGQTYKSKVAGATDATITINYMFDSTGHTELTNITPTTTGTFTLSTNGTTGPQFSATTVVESHRVSSPTEGFVVGTIVLGVDSAMTIT